MWQHLQRLIIHTLVGLVEGSVGWVTGKELTMTEMCVFGLSVEKNTGAAYDASQADWSRQKQKLQQWDNEIALLEDIE